MYRSSLAKVIVGGIAVVAVLGVLRYKPWQRGGNEEGAVRQQLSVGFLPVT